MVPELYPNYEFITKGARGRYAGNAWVLTVDISTDELVQDAVVYYPNTNYPSPKEVATSRRIGDWAHVAVARLPNRSRKFVVISVHPWLKFGNETLAENRNWPCRCRRH